MTALDDRRDPVTPPGDSVVRYLHPQPPADTRAGEAGASDLELADQPEPANRPPGTELVPAGASDIEPAEKVYDAEIVEDDQPAPGPVRKALQPMVLVVQHDRTVAAGKVIARNFVYIVAGAGVLAKRRYDRKHKFDRYERAAEVAGDQESLRYWHEQGEQSVAARHKRLMERAERIWRQAIRTLFYIPIAAFLLVLVGVAVAAISEDWGLLFAPLVGTVKAVGWLVVTSVALGWLLLLVLVTLALGALWWFGRQANAAPSFLAPTVAEEELGDVMDRLPDERMITQALRKTLPALDRAIKEGWHLHYLVPPMPDGKGWAVEIALPQAAPVEDFVRNKTDLAHNLRRYPNEVWLSEPQAAVLGLWVAKPGALSGPVDPWPLLQDLDNARTDYFRGVPIGVTIKGDTVIGRLSEVNWVAGGMMGSGKSTLVITALCGAMLDPVVDIDVVVMAENVDYDPMQPRLKRLVTGIDTAEQCMAMLYELYDEISQRGKALKDHDQRAVTREIAAKDPRLKPRIMVIDECQNLFIGEHGKDAIEVTTKVMSTARKYGITLMFLTPEPSKDALPRKLISIASNKACYAIGDHQANDAVLGSGSYKSGISAVGLTPKTDEGPGDVGTCMQRGFTAKPGLMRGFYIAQPDVHRVTQRALQLRGGRGRQLIAAPGIEVRDLLVDVDDLLDGRDASAADVARLLAQKFPDHVPYRNLNGVDLAARLTAEGAKVPTTKNRHPVYGRVVKEARRARDERSG